MAKWFLWLVFIFGIMCCQSETRTNASKIPSLPSESGTVAPPSRATVPLIFFLKELEILNNEDVLSLLDHSLFRSLPPGVYKIQGDTILFGRAPIDWVSSGITRWPKEERVALADIIISEKPLLNTEIGIFPQKPGQDGYLPGCFSCPNWMARKHGALAVFWEQFLNK